MATTLKLLIAVADDAAVQDNTMRALHVDSYLRQVTWRTGFDYHAVQHLAVSGVALGVDQDFCGVCARLDPPMPYVAAVPFPGQESRWPTSSQRVYAAVLERAAGVVYVSSPTTPRDDDGGEEASSGGTGNMVRSCRRAGLQPHVIDPRDYREQL